MPEHKSSEPNWFDRWFFKNIPIREAFYSKPVSTAVWTVIAIAVCIVLIVWLAPD